MDIYIFMQKLKKYEGNNNDIIIFLQNPANK